MTKWLYAILVILALAAPVSAQITAPDQPEKSAPEQTDKKSKHGDVLTDTPDNETQFEQVRHALVRLPIAVVLASILAMRPRRRGTPPRQAPVIQTQIILAIVGAVVMLVVGSSLARAFGIVGAAGLVRYRAKIADPKDAGVMLSTLAVGLASGVGLWMLAMFAAGFIVVVLGIVESFEPQARQLFTLTVKTKDPAGLKPKIEALLTRRGAEHELRTATKDEVTLEVHLPIGRTTDRLSNEILQIDPQSGAEVKWEEKKAKS